ncbi:GNAT family N-acetyltransferase [Flavobacterium oreochromis]|nr:GNAT family N-acetyltransferase [Flavobacterium oreochromis]
MKYAFKHLNLPKLYAYTQTKNHSSNKMAEKIHMRLTNEFTYDNQNWNWYELGTLKYDMIITKQIINDIEIKISPVFTNNNE